MVDKGQRRLWMQFEDITFQKERHIARVTINRPERYNAFDARTCSEIEAAISDASKDRRIGVIVITGAGDAFSSGGYLGDLAKASAAQLRCLFDSAFKMFTAIRRARQPVIAAVNGYAMGGGNELVVACDLAIASQKAKFGQTGPKIGSSPIYGGTNMLSLIIGEKKAKEVCYLCRVYTADEALQLGWINKVVPHDKLYDEVEAWCHEILDKSPTYLEITKVTSNVWWDMLAPSFSHAGLLLAEVAGCPEMIEGASSFLGKKKPDFRRFRR